MLKVVTTGLATVAVAISSLGSIAPAAAAAPILRPLTPVRGDSRTQPVIRSASTQTNLAKFLTLVGGRYVGHANIAGMTIDVATPLRNASALKTYAQVASTPGSAYYRKFLTPQQIADAFGSTTAQYASTTAYFKKYGLFVKPWKTRTFITVSGPGAAFERALGTRFGTYQTRNRVTGKLTTFYAPSTVPLLSATIGSANMRSLVSVATRTVHTFIGGPSVPVSAGFSNARVNGATPYELAKAYDYQTAYQDGFTGKGVNLGIIGTGPISVGDVPAYRQIFQVPGSSTVTQVDTTGTTVAGDTTPPPVTAPCTGSLPTCNPEDEEAQLDTEQTAMLAYDANVLFYLAYEPSGPSIGIDAADDELMQAVDDNQTDILSLSYGGCEVLETALLALQATPGFDATGTDPTLFQELAAEGVATFVSSGDTGSAGCQRATGNSDAPNASYPASDPNVVAVGGTTTPILPNGTLSGPITSWGSQTKSGGAEGSGTSIDFQTPPYQANVGTVSGMCLMRCLPDVVLDADPFTGAAVLYNYGTGANGAGLGGPMEAPIGGTSQAAPDMAAMWAVVLSACRVTPACGNGSSSNVVDPTTPPFSPTLKPAHTFRLGNPNFYWYKLADATTPATVATYHNTFYDIVFGDDAVPPYSVTLVSAEAGSEGANIGAYAAGTDPGSTSAGAGYDVTTGLGAPFARSLIRYVVGV